MAELSRIQVSASDEAMRKVLFSHGLATVVGITLGSIIPLLVIVSGPVSPTSLLTAGVTVWAGWRLAQLIARGEPLLYDFTFWLYVYVFLGMAATAQVALRAFPSTMPGINTDFLEPAAFISVVGIAAWELGRAIANRGAAPTLRPERLPDATRARVLLLAGLVFAAYYTLKVGVIPLLSSRDAVAVAKAAAWPNPTVAVIVSAASFTPLLVGIHALTQQRRLERSLGGRLPVSMLLMASVVTLLFVANPIGNPRIQVGTVFMSFLPLMGCFSTRARGRTTMLAIVGVFVVLFPYADYFRRATTALTVMSPMEQFANKGDYDSYPQIVNTAEHVARFGHSDGVQALGSTFFWVPRALWSSKPIDTGILVAQQKGYHFTNVSAPLWAEAFIDGGWVLLVLVFVAVGYLMRRASLRAVAELPTFGMGGISAAILSFYMLIMLRGSLLQAMCVFVALLACLRFVRRRVPSEEAKHASSSDPVLLVGGEPMPGGMSKGH